MGKDCAPESSVSGVRSLKSLSLSASLLLARSARSFWIPGGGKDPRVKVDIIVGGTGVVRGFV